MLGASVENFEATWEAERRGEIPERYVIEAVIQSTTDPTLAPEGLHTLTLGVQQLPFELADGQTWDGIKESWADKVVAELCEYAPNLKDHILDRAVITPQDLERDYLITGGNIFHGQMYLDQLFDARPLSSISSYRTPIGGYYLCGVGMHPGRRRHGRIRPQRGAGGAGRRRRRRHGDDRAPGQRGIEGRDRPDHGDRHRPQGRLQARALQGLPAAGQAGEQAKGGLMRLEGKGAVVTGGGRGLGREVVLLMAGEGAGVVVFDVNADGAEAVAAEAREAGGRAVAFAGDVTNEDDLAAAIARCRDEFASFDVIHNNAGVQVEKPLHESTVEDFDWVTGRQPQRRLPRLQAGGDRDARDAAAAASSTRRRSSPTRAIPTCRSTPGRKRACSG